MESIDKTISVYNKGYGRYARLYNSPSSSVNQFLSYIPPQGLILEVGSGVGADANYFTQKGFAVIATDMSEGMIATAKKTHPHIDFRIMDMRSLAFPDTHFDGIFAESCLLHIPKAAMEKTIQGFARTLKQNGILEIGIQEGDSQEIFLPAPFLPEEIVFVNVLSYSESHTLLLRNGFSILAEFSSNPKKNQHPFVKRKIFAKKIS